MMSDQAGGGWSVDMDDYHFRPSSMVIPASQGEYCLLGCWMPALPARARLWKAASSRVLVKRWSNFAPFCP